MSKNANILPFYNKIVDLTRKYFLYNDFKLPDSFSSRINLIFFHLSFILILLRKKQVKNDISQNIFDFFFKQIEINLRELGYGDTVINKKMKLIIKLFYEILFNLKNWDKHRIKEKEELIINFFENKQKDKISHVKLVDYFNKFTLFIEDIPLNSLLKGVFSFDYRGK